MLFLIPIWTILIVLEIWDFGTMIMLIRTVAALLMCVVSLLNSPLALANPADDAVVKQVVDNNVPAFMANNQIPGISIAIYYKGKDYFFNYGVANKQQNIPVSKDTIFELASITKIFVSTLLAVEVQDNKIQLNDPIVKYLPRLSNTSGLPIDQVKVVDLATHSSSFPRAMEQFGVATGNINGLYNRLRNWQPNVPIGTQYKYSNVGFGLLGAVVADAADQSLPLLLNQNIVNPLAMSHTFFNLPQNLMSMQAQGYRPNGNPAPHYVAANFLGGGALRSSAADLLKFMKANLGIKVENASPQLLSAMQFAQQPHFQIKPQFSMALGWEQIRRGQGILITKNGGNQGFSTFIGFSPSKQLGVVVLTNKAKGKATMLGHQILRGLLSQPL